MSGPTPRRLLPAPSLLVSLLVPLLCLGLLNGALAQQYRVDDSGGPLTLAEDVAGAAAAWNRAAEEVNLEEVAGTGALIRFGDPESMGPDLVSLTLLPEDGTMEVRLQPRIYRDYPAALLHELGLLVGLPVGGQGVMAPALTAGERTVLGEEETTALANLRERVTGDLDGDGDVDLADLAVLGRAYGQRGVNLAADLDGDGSVGAGDLEVLRGAYRFDVPGAEPGTLAPEGPDDPEGDGPGEETDDPATEIGAGENDQQDADPESGPGADPESGPNAGPEADQESDQESDDQESDQDAEPDDEQD